MTDVKSRANSLIIFISFEILCGCYVMYLYKNENISWFLPLGIIFIITGLALLLAKNWIRILNIAYSSLFLIWYFMIYWDLLIKRGYITEIGSPFFLMGLIPHLPVIFFNLSTIIFLTHRKVKTYFR